MTNATTPQVVRSYLAALEAALTGVPREVADDIIAGVAEELDGLSAADAAARIEELGDPVFIAAEARSGAEPAQEATTPPAAATSPSGYAIAAVLFLILGGFVIPFIGWVIGVVLLWTSPIWTTRQKWAGALAGPIAAVVGVALFVSISLLASIATAGSIYPAWHAMVLAAPILATVGNVWIGIRLLRSAQARR